MKLTDAEWQVMNGLWDKHPATARELAGRLEEQQWAYTTIKTMLARLVEKEAVREYKQGNTSMYEPLLSRQNARRSALRTILEQAFDGALAPMLSFLVEDKKLSSPERKALLEMLQASTTNTRDKAEK